MADATQDNEDREQERRLRELEIRTRERAERQAEEDEKAKQKTKTGEEERLRKEAMFLGRLIKTDSKALWIFISILILGLGASWWFGKLNIALIIILVFFFIGLIWWGFESGIKYQDSTSIFIAVAFIIWAIDLWPSTWPLGQLLGPPYAGFKFDFSGVLDTNWAAVATSGVVFGMLMFGMFKDIAKKHIISFLVSFSLVLFLNQSVNYYLTSTLSRNYLNYIFLISTIVVVGILFFLKHKVQLAKIGDYPTYVLMALVFSFFWVNIGWIRNWRAFAHVLYILWFGFFYLARKEEENPAFWHILIPSLLIFDFYGYGLLWNSAIDVLRFIPTLVLFVLFYCAFRKEENTYATVSLAFVVGIILIFILQTQVIEATSIQFEAQRGADVKDFYKQFKDKLTQAIEGRLDIATAGLYRGSVEKNRYESLGVYFSNIRAADPKFYTDEAITVWGSIRSKTYKDAVIINFSCYRWKGSDKETNKIRADKIEPSTKIPIFTLENVDTECVFLPKPPNDPKVIQPGSNTITFSAEYNFGTDAYVKAYFIDRDRFRAYAREEVDIFKEFGIRDKKPLSVSTNGPVEVGIKVGSEDSSLVTVSQGYAIKPAIGITLTNRQEIQDKDKRIIQRWEGKIKNITELILLVPPGIRLHNEEELESETGCKSKKAEEKIKCPCSMPFVKYDTNKCKKTCQEAVLTPCVDACIQGFKEGGITTTTDDYAFDTTTDYKNYRSNCINECGTSTKNCETECDFLFSTDGEEGLKGIYTGYALDVGSLEFKDLNKDIDKHRSFLCRFDPTQSVLDANPVTTRYFRVRARYNYLLENSVTVNVEETPIEAIELIDPDILKTVLESAYALSDIHTVFSYELTLAVASVETGMRHCCRDADKTTASTCVGTRENTCIGGVIKSYDGSSIGIMQINTKCKECPERNERLQKQWCVPGKTIGRTIYDKDCNLMVGAAILKDNYNKFSGGIKPQNLQLFCPNKVYDTYPDRYNKYLSYSGNYAAIRAYNGWGCRPESGCQKACGDKPKCIENCIKGTIDYVEKVRKAAQSISGAQITDPTTLKSITPTETTPVREEETIEQITQLTSLINNPEGIYDQNTNTVTISWEKSIDSTVSGYRVTRDTSISICINILVDGRDRYSCIDNKGGLELGKTYTYSIIPFIKGTVDYNSKVDVPVPIGQQTQPIQQTTLKPPKPLNPLAKDTPNDRNSIIISWNSPETEGIYTYEVYRYSFDELGGLVLDKFYKTTNLYFTDNEVKDGVQHKYAITAVKTFDESNYIYSDYAWTDIVRSVDDFKS